MRVLLESMESDGKAARHAGYQIFRCVAAYRVVVKKLNHNSASVSKRGNFVTKAN